MIYDREMTPVDIENCRIKRRRWFFALVILSVLVAAIYWRLYVPVPVDYQSNAEHFKYGSIGSDTRYGGIPLRVWQVLPEIFPEYLPSSGEQFLRIPKENRDYLDAYASFGFIIEPGHVMPIGFSQRRVGVDLIGLNCAACHVSTIQLSDGFSLERLYAGKPVSLIKRRSLGEGTTVESAIVYGMPANTVDLEAYFAFLFQCAADERFTIDNILSAIEQRASRLSSDHLGVIDKLALRTAIPQLRDTLLLRRSQLHYLSLLPRRGNQPAMPRFGPGRIDTFSPYKSIQFGFAWDGTSGIADYPAIWNQRPREGMHLHWDGNNTSVFERNISASLGAGASPVSLDMHRMLRVASWIGSPLPPNATYGGNPQAPSRPEIEELRENPFPEQQEMQIPAFPFNLDASKVSAGKKLFESRCANCHDWSGDKCGLITDIAYIKTDAARLDSYTEELLANQLLLGAGQWWRFKNFRKTQGYANAPLDGIWARAPYLHNGSVPTLYDLFLRPVTQEDLKQLNLDTVEKLNALVAKNRVGKLIQLARSLGLRPPIFYRGDDRYDQVNGGFQCDQPIAADGRRLFLYSTLVASDSGDLMPGKNTGNGHHGHYGGEFGTSKLDERQIAELVEYQKRIGEENVE